MVNGLSLLSARCGACPGRGESGAAALGWQATLLDDLGTEALATLLGVGDPQGAEVEQPDCVLAVYPQGGVVRDATLPSEVLETFVKLPWVGSRMC